GLMLTNPNTLGLFEEQIQAITEAVHRVGALVYYDGANLNAIIGRVRPGDMGFDIVHMNTHKTFATPHGGGGPGAGPVAVTKRLIDLGFHPSTVYFPLVVEEAMMVEPTETETRDTLDAFAEALVRTAAEAAEDPDLLHEAPVTTPVRRLDEAKAARELRLTWSMEPTHREPPASDRDAPTPGYAPTA